MFEVCVWVILFTMAQLPASSASAPPRDVGSSDGPAKGGTATLRGRVTDRDTGQPLGRVMVTLISSAWREQAMASAMIAQSDVADDASLRQSRPRSTMTAADGRFEFKQLPPGAYTVTFQATMLRGTHLDQSFGESAPRDPSKPANLEKTSTSRSGARSPWTAASSTIPASRWQMPT
jgi:hypothetical protein